MIITPYSTEIENIVFEIQSQPNQCIAITSVNRQEGVSSICHSIVQRLLLSGHATLLVDLNFANPSVERIINSGEDSNLIGEPSLVSPFDEESVFTGVQISADKANAAYLRKPETLRLHLEQWKSAFEYIIVDCPSLLNRDESALPAEQIASACGTAIIVTMAQKTTESRLIQAIGKLNQDTADLLGVIINDCFNPGLEHELLRQMGKLQRFLPSACTFAIDKVKSLIKQTPFFTLNTEL